TGDLWTDRRFAPYGATEWSLQDHASLFFQTIAALVALALGYPGHSSDKAEPGHFFAAPAEAMRRILIDSAWRRKSLKRGGHQRVDLRPAAATAKTGISPDDLPALNDALETLDKTNAEVADLVNLRLFAGLTAQQAVLALGISHNTADAYWAYARAWLRVQMAQGTERGQA
ncbi:MAG: hypothetical protein JSW27_09240, partial [Phycisphaerales bacterium]